MDPAFIFRTARKDRRGRLQWYSERYSVRAGDLAIGRPDLAEYGPGGMSPSGKWLLAGACDRYGRRVLDAAAIQAEPKRLLGLVPLDLDHGTRRSWGAQVVVSVEQDGRILADLERDILGPRRQAARDRRNAKRRARTSYHKAGAQGA